MEMVGFNKREKRELRRDLKRKRGQVWNARFWEPAMHAGGAGKPGVRKKADGDVELWDADMLGKDRRVGGNVAGERSLTRAVG